MNPAYCLTCVILAASAVAAAGVDARAQSGTAYDALRPATVLPQQLGARPKAEKSVPGTDFNMNRDQPVLLSADNIGYDTTARHVIARGNVEIIQGLTVLIADQVEYFEETGAVLAKGNVAVMESTGNVYFADQVELRDEMQRGVVAYFKGRLADGSLFTAREAERKSEHITELMQAVYSPCAIVCEDGSPKKPTWAVTADKVHIDMEDENITYDDVWVEVYGQKMLYTPYLSHATPGAANKSGFLSPKMQRDANLGMVAETPYLYVIDQTRDLTITPMILSTDAPVLKAEYRQKWDRGNIIMDGSFTVPRDRNAAGSVVAGRTYRGHIDGRGFYDISNAWQTGFTLKRTTDDTYLTRYKINRNESLLTSRAYIEGINPLNNGNRRHYLTTEVLHFQGLTAQDDRRRTPFVMPLTEFGYTTDPMLWGSRFSVDSSLLVLTRDNGADSRRFASRFNWNLPYVTRSGHMFALDTSLRADAYDVDDVLLSNNTRYEGTETRVVPEMSLSWRYPLLRRLEASNLMVEPIASITVSPHNNNSERIPNEDNVLPEFNDLNLFSRNRFAGWDRIESGTRMYYGMRTLWDFYENRQISASLGQAYRFDNDPLFPLTNDLRSRFSDYVGQLSATYHPLTLSYRFRLDRDNLEQQRSEIESGLNFGNYGAFVNYLRLNDDPFLGSREEVVGGGFVRLNDVWTLSASTRRDLELARLTEASIGLQFQNECTTLIFGVNRNLITDRDIRDSTTGYIQLMLRNLE